MANTNKKPSVGTKLGWKAKKAQIARYKKQTKLNYKKGKSQMKINLINAKNQMPMEKMKEQAKVQKHTIWAGTIGGMFGRGTSTAQNIVQGNTSNLWQNVNGGLTNTQNGRDEDEGKDEVEGGGVVY